MSEAYKEAMSYIAVTEEMKSRILRNVKSANLEKKKGTPFCFAKRYMAAAACLALLIVGAVSLATFRTPAHPENLPGNVNGIFSVKKASSAHELSQLAGFEIEDLKYVPFDVTEVQYASYEGKLAEIKYIGESQNLVFRKMEGSTDPSGDFTAYSDTATLNRDGVSISLKGESGTYALAVWQDGTYSYSMKSSVPLPELEWANILEPEGQYESPSKSFLPVDG